MRFSHPKRAIILILKYKQKRKYSSCLKVAVAPSWQLVCLRYVDLWALISGHVWMWTQSNHLLTENSNSCANTSPAHRANDRIYKCLHQTANYLFHYLVINSFLLGIIHECQGNCLFAAGDPSGLQVFGFQAGLYNHANGHQPDSQPANGGCTPQPDQPDLTRCDITIPEIITIKAKHLEKEYQQTITTYLWSIFAKEVWSNVK